MRLRLISADAHGYAGQYAAVSRRVANDLRLSRFDPTTFEPALMYWPYARGRVLLALRGRAFLDQMKCWPMPTGGRLALAHATGGGTSGTLQQAERPY